MAQNNASEQLNNLLISKNFNPQSLDASGKPATSPDDTDLYSFDYQAESGNDYGTVVVMLDHDGNMNVYFGDNLGKSMEPEDKKSWFDFLYQLRMFAKRNLLSFSLQNLNKLKYSMAGQAAIKEGLFESWTGTKNTSWNGQPTEARLMIKHKKTIGEGDARFRYIESLFVETAEGERYKLPFTKLSGGRAMIEHVRQGGKPYDIRGQHIVTIVTEMNLLSRFKRANQGRIFEGETAQLVQEATNYYESLHRNLKSLSTKQGYAKYFESWDPAALTDEDVIIEDLRHMFVEQNIDSRVEQALPLLARLQKETTMKEANIFEDWANLITEGTWAIPDTKEKQSALVTLLSQELPVGADAINATEQLYDLLGDDELFDKLGELAEQDANADARSIILDRLEELKDNHDIAQVIGQLKMQSSPDDADDEDAANYDDPDGNTTDIDDGPQNAYDSDERTRSDQFEARDQLATLRNAAGLPVQESAMSDLDIGRQDCKSMNDTEFEKAYKMTKKEWQTKYADVLKENVLTDDTGSTLQHILDTYKRDVRDFKETGEVSKHLHDALYDYYFDDMPYGVQKARDGDPYEWVADRFAADLGIPGSGMNSPGIGPEDDPSIEREGAIGGAIGAVGGALVGGPVGAAIGGGIGGSMEEEKTEFNMDKNWLEGKGIPSMDQRCNMSPRGKNCAKHGLEECWEVSMNEERQDGSLARLQDLAGIALRDKY